MKNTYYLTHSAGFDYENELYTPIKQSPLWQDNRIILLYEQEEVKNSKDWIREADLILAETSYPSTGQGIELGWANLLGKTIICFYKKGAKPSRSLQFITQQIFEYSNTEELIKKLGEL